MREALPVEEKKNGAAGQKISLVCRDRWFLMSRRDLARQRCQEIGKDYGGNASFEEIDIEA